MPWFPYEVLEIDDISACVGYADSRDRRCGNRLSFAKTEAAEILLGRMSCDVSPSTARMNEYLEQLAHYLLCPPWHDGQAPSLIATWKQRVLRFRRTQVVQAIRDLETTMNDITARLEASSLAYPQPAPSYDLSRTRVLEENSPVRPNAVPHSGASSSSRQRFTTLNSNVSEPSSPQLNANGQHFPQHSMHNSPSSSYWRSIPPTSAAVRRPLQFNADSNLLRHQHNIYDRRSTPLPSAAVRQAVQSNSNRDFLSSQYNAYNGVSSVDGPCAPSSSVAARQALQLNFGSDSLRPQYNTYSGVSSADGRTTSSPSVAVQQPLDGNEQSQHLKEDKRDCPICLDGFESMHDVARCHGCLGVYHQRCNDTWIRQCKNSGLDATCPCW